MKQKETPNPLKIEGNGELNRRSLFFITEDRGKSK